MGLEVPQATTLLQLELRALLLQLLMLHPHPKSPLPQAKDISAFKVPEKEFTMEEVAKHNKKDDLWIVVKGVVMDVTNWLDEHPGGTSGYYQPHGT